MASAFGHSFLAITLVKVAGERKIFSKLAFFAILSCVLPDADSISFWLGIPYGDVFGHRGITHSLSFGLLWAASISHFFFREEPRRFLIFLILLLSTVSHGILDAMTTGGLGVGFFIPFENSRYFFPFRPIEVSPISVSRFFDQAQRILVNEFIWIGLPCLGLLAAKRLFKAVPGR